MGGKNKGCSVCNNNSGNALGFRKTACYHRISSTDENKDSFIVMDDQLKTKLIQNNDLTYFKLNVSDSLYSNSFFRIRGTCNYLMNIKEKNYVLVDNTAVEILYGKRIHAQSPIAEIARSVAFSERIPQGASVHHRLESFDNRSGSLQVLLTQHPNHGSHGFKITLKNTDDFDEFVKYIQATASMCAKCCMSDGFSKGSIFNI